MHDGFQVHELMQSIKTKFASMPRALDAAEWGFRRRCKHLVDSGHTSLAIAEKPVLPLFFFSPARCTQPEGRVMGDSQGTVSVGGTENHRHRYESHLKTDRTYHRPTNQK